MITLKIEIKYNLIEKGSLVWLFRILLKVIKKASYIDFSYSITNDSKKISTVKTTPYIRSRICTLLQVPEDKLNTGTRKREVVEAKQIGHFFSKKLTKDSLATIGSQIGDMDHCTVLHSIKTVNNLLETNKEFKAKLELLEKQL